MTISRLFLFIIILLFLFILPSSAFEDDMQKHPGDDPEQGDSNILWYVTSNPGVHVPGFNMYPYGATYNKAYQNYVRASNHYRIYSENYYKSSSNYLSYVNRYCGVRPGAGGGSAIVYIAFYDDNGVLLNSVDISAEMNAYDDNDTWEFIRSSNSLYLYINGDNQGSIAAMSDDYSYFKITFGTTYNAGNGALGSNMYLDCVSQDGYVIGVATEESPDIFINTASNNIIDVEWTANTIDPYGTWNDTETFQIRVTWMDAGTIVNTTTLDTSKPNGFVEYNRSTLMPVPNYGIYKFDLLKDSVVMGTEYLTFAQIGSSGTLSWDKVDYVPYQNASITYAVTPYTPNDYNYYIRTYEINTGLVDTNTITANSGSMTESLDTWDPGSYYSLLVVVDKSDSSEYTVAFDVFDINDEVRFEGYTYDAENGTILNETNVNFSQSTSWYNTTSNATAFYELDGLSDSVQITLNASKTNFTHEDFTFVPPTSKLYTTNLYLFPSNRSLNGTSIVEGMTVDYPLHQAVGSATVNLYNATWSNTTTSNAFGYYQFNLSELVNGTYTVNATLSGYDNSSEYSITIVKNESTVQNIVLNQAKLLILTTVDSITGNPILNFTASVNGMTTTVGDGDAEFYLYWGLYTVTATSTSYYSSSENVLVDQNRSVEISLTPIVTKYYDPRHYVEFILTALNGTRYPNVEVNVYIGDSVTALHTNTTDTLGSVVFELDQDVKYRLTFIDATLGINEEIEVFPIDVRYYVYIDESITFDPGNVSTNLTNYTVNYTTRPWSLQNLTSAEVNSTIGLGLLGQGIVASIVMWVVVGAGGPAVGIIAVSGMAMLGIVSWIMVLFCGMTTVSLYILGSKIQ